MKAVASSADQMAANLAQPAAPPVSRKSVNLRAFNLYAAKVRKETKDLNPGKTGYEIERLIGKKWAKLADDRRDEFVQQAQKEREELLQQGLVKEDQGKARKKKRKNEVDLLALALKQSKPEDKATLLQHLPGLVKPKKSKPGQHVDATEGDGSPAAALIGTPVSGVIDGMFDAGYFVTLRVGEKRQAFRGVVFRPDLHPPAGRMDIAPKVWTLDTREGLGGEGQGAEGNALGERVNGQEPVSGTTSADAQTGANGHEGANGPEIISKVPEANGHKHVDPQENVDRLNSGIGQEPGGVNGQGGENGHHDVNRQNGANGNDLENRAGLANGSESSHPMEVVSAREEANGSESVKRQDGAKELEGANEQGGTDGAGSVDGMVNEESMLNMETALVQAIPTGEEGVNGPVDEGTCGVNITDTLLEPHGGSQELQNGQAGKDGGLSTGGSERDLQVASAAPGGAVINGREEQQEGEAPQSMEEG